MFICTCETFTWGRTFSCSVEWEICLDRWSNSRFLSWPPVCSFTNISFRLLKLSGNSNHLDYSARHFDFLFSSAPAIKTDLFPLGGFLNSAPFRNARCCGHVYAICKMEIYTSLDSLGKIAYQTQAFSPNCQDCCVVTRLLGICLNMIYYSPSNTWNNSTPSSYLFVSCCK